MTSRQEVIDRRASILLMAAVLIAGVIAWILLAGGESDSPASVTQHIGYPEVVTESWPAHIQEGVIYGEIDPLTVTLTAEIVPVHEVENALRGSP